MMRILAISSLFCFLMACGGSGPNGNEFEITYPKSGYSGFNLLSGEFTKLDSTEKYGFIADVPGGSVTRIEMENTGPKPPTAPDEPGGGLWKLDPLQNTGWYVDPYDYDRNIQEFHCDGPAKAYLGMDFLGCGKATIRIYEFRKKEPVHEYEISWTQGCPE